MKPLISVIMPAYNAEKYIAKAIQSILDQTYTNYELIIIDDASTDNTWEIIQSFKRKDRRIVTLRNKINQKLGTSLNKCILKSKGKYIARMDADDWSFLNRLHIQYEYMESNPKVGMSGGAMMICDDKLIVQGKREYKLVDGDIRKRIFLYSPFSHPTVIFRKSILTKSGLYDKRYNPAEDYELYFRIGKFAEFGNLPQALIKYRVIQNSMTTGSTKAMELKTLSIRLKYAKKPPYSMNIMDQVYFFLEFISIYIVPNIIRLGIFNLFRNSSFPGSITNKVHSEN